MNAIEKKSVLMLASAAAAMVVCASMADADPLPGRDVLKFEQRPMDGLTITDPTGQPHVYWGHDELSTAYSQVGPAGVTPYRGTFMADDFADKFNSPVVHVKWWGSYLNNFQSAQFPVNKFLISFEADVPQSTANPFSHPGQVLSSQIVTLGALAPGSGTYTEKPISAGGPPLSETLYEYNTELHLGHEFFQKADEVYWLKIVALVDVPAGVIIDPDQPPTFVPRWGWHNRDYSIMDPLASTGPAVVPGERIVGAIGPAPGGVPIWHFQDDAVTGQVVVNPFLPGTGFQNPLVDQAGYAPTRYLPLADGPQLIGDFSKDLAFALYTVPEPGVGMLLVGGVATVMGRRRRA